MYQSGRSSMDSEGSQPSQPNPNQPLSIEIIKQLMDDLCTRQDQLLERRLTEFHDNQQQELRSFRECIIDDFRREALPQIPPSPPHQPPVIHHPQTIADDDEDVGTSSSPIEFRPTKEIVEEIIEDWLKGVVGDLRKRVAVLEDSHTQQPQGLLAALLPKRKSSSNLKVVDCYPSALLLLMFSTTREALRGRSLGVCCGV